MHRKMRLKITSLNKHSLGWWAKNAVYIGDNVFSCKNRTYLHDVYHDNSKDLVLMKARQTGATTYGLIKALWLAVAHGKNTSYFMPDQDWANRVSKVRLNDDIILYSPKIKCLIGKNNVNEVKSRKIGQGWIHFRGLVSASGTQETPADMVIFDEYDKVKDLKKVDEALSQLGESEYKWMLRMGLPSIPNYGIHKEFLTTDQRFWNVKCEHCNKFTILSEVFPKCVKRIGDYEVVRVCPHCGGSIDPLIGQYIAKEPKIERRRGYHFSRLNSVFANLDRILKWYDSGDNKATFQHEILGHAYTEAENRLSTAQIAACRRSTFNHEYTHLRNIMGVDTGKKLHVVILRGLPPVFSSLGGQKEPRYELITFKEVDTFQDVANLMEKYNIYCCVTDPQCSKERHAEAWSFIREHLGRVYGCYYTNSPKQLITVNKKQQVSVYRTGTLDKSHDSIVKQRLHIPQYDLYDPEFVEFSKHMCNLIKVVHSHDLTGEKKVKWINVGPDHYRHALNYAEIAYDIMYENRSGTWGDIEKLKNCRINTSCDFDLGYGLDI